MKNTMKTVSDEETYTALFFRKGKRFHIVVGPLSDVYDVIYFHAAATHPVTTYIFNEKQILEKKIDLNRDDQLYYSAFM